MKYTSLFFDLDDTLWAFTENTADTFKEMYRLFNFQNYFDSYEHFYELYETKNLELWDRYTRKEITRDELNACRFAHPLKSVGVHDDQLAANFRKTFLKTIPTKKKSMPNAIEVLEYLKPRYNMYILSNGFRELQHPKMVSAGLDLYFKRIILSEDIGIMKPYPEIFNFALSATQSEARRSLMIGDNWDADITGARGAGIDQVFYNFNKKEELSFRPTYLIEDLKELVTLL